jgi:hypothetical protein
MVLNPGYFISQPYHLTPPIPPIASISRLLSGQIGGHSAKTVSTLKQYPQAQSLSYPIGITSIKVYINPLTSGENHGDSN